MDYEHRKKKKQGKTQWQFGMCPIYPRKVLQLWTQIRSSLSLSQFFFSIQGLLFFFSSLLSFFFFLLPFTNTKVSLFSFLSVSQFHLHLSLCRFFLFYFSIKVSFILEPSLLNFSSQTFAPYALTASLNSPNSCIVTPMIFHFSTTPLSVSFRI